jgi:hypothetical protein
MYKSYYIKIIHQAEAKVNKAWMISKYIAAMQSIG